MPIVAVVALAPKREVALVASDAEVAMEAVAVEAVVVVVANWLRAGLAVKVVAQGLGTDFARFVQLDLGMAAAAAGRQTALPVAAAPAVTFRALLETTVPERRALHLQTQVCLVLGAGRWKLWLGQVPKVRPEGLAWTLCLRWACQTAKDRPEKRGGKHQRSRSRKSNKECTAATSSF